MRFTSISIALIVILHSVSLSAQNPGTPLTEEIRNSVLQTLKEQILGNYAIEEMAEKIHDSLTNSYVLDRYKNKSTHVEFIDHFELDLQAWSNDLHFKVWYTGILPDLSSLPQPVIPKMKMLEDEIAYLYDIQKLSNRHIKLFKNLMEEVVDANAIIIDLRNCSGGDSKAVLSLSSYFFENSIHLVSYEFRDTETKIEMTQRKKKSRELWSIPVYILTSEKTASGGESLAYLLKHHEKAKIVGSTTMGAAHGVKTFELSHNYRAFIPYSRPVHPKTGENWENVGVIPDIKISSEKALDKAIELIQANAGKN